MLYDFLEKEKSLQIVALFTDSIHIEGYDEELQQLLVHVEDERLLRERVDGIWEFLAVTSINQDITTMVRSCEGLWNDLLPQVSSLEPLINTMRAIPEASSWSKPAQDGCSPVHPWPYRN
ncbi:hypothetical protein DVH05_019041 [Phytophthora capsici]|nr:hypothetical protein DVH05_019041 [Phytophthora capsici]